MHIHIDIFERDFQKQRQHRMTVAREHIGVSAAHRACQQPVFYRAAIDEEILMIGNAAIVGGQSGNTREAHAVALHIDGHPVVLKLASDNLGHALAGALHRLHRENAPLAMGEGEADIGPRHRQAAHHIVAGGIFAARSAQEFAPRWHFGKQLFDPNTRSGGDGGRPILCQRAMIDHAPPAFACISRAALDSQSGYAGDAWERLSPETQRGNLLNRLVGQFGSRVAFQRKRHLLRVHRAAIIGNFERCQPAFDNAHRDPRRTCIHCIFDQFFQRRSGALHHLACRDPVYERFWKAANLRHEPSLSGKMPSFRGKPVET